MGEEQTKLLFKALSMILENQKDIMRHIGASNHDSNYGWNDSSIESLIRECDREAY